MPAPEITDIHQLIAETLACGGPVADELDAASEVLDALRLADVWLVHREGPVPWPETECEFGDPFCPCQDGDPCHYVDQPGSPAMIAPGMLALAEAEAEAAAEEDRCPHCGGEPDDPTSHLKDCRTIDTCAQTEPDLAEPWHPESEWFDGDWRTFSQQLNEHIRDHHRRSAP